jgi:hypothetical protein
MVFGWILNDSLVIKYIINSGKYVFILCFKNSNLYFPSNVHFSYPNLEDIFMLLIVQELKLVVFKIIAHIIAFGSNMFLILMLCLY